VILIRVTITSLGNMPAAICILSRLPQWCVVNDVSWPALDQIRSIVARSTLQRVIPDTTIRVSLPARY